MKTVKTILNKLATYETTTKALTAEENNTTGLTKDVECLPSMNNEPMP